MWLASIDGAVAPVEESLIPVSDEGLLRGDGGFEVLRVYGGRPFALDDHFARLGRTCAGLRLEPELDALRAEALALLERAGEPDSLLRLVVTRGGRRIAIVEPLPQRPAAARVATVTYAPTRVLNGLKTLSYAGNMLAGRIAKEQGADEALLVTPHGRVLEAPTSSIFWVSAEGPLRTPALSTGILESITRSKVIRELHVEEGEYELDDLLTAHEAFLASTTREVQAVSAIDGRGLDAPGPRTLEAAEGFARRLDDELDARAPA
jgi:branched-chain amino acid aminotransferase